MRNSMNFLHSLAAFFRKDTEANIERIKQGQAPKSDALPKVRGKELVVHVFAQPVVKKLSTPMVQKTGMSLLKLWMCQEEEKTKCFSHTHSDLEKRKRNFSKSSSHETQPYSSINKISPRIVSPNASQGSGFTSNGGFHIPLTLCQPMSSSDDESQKTSEREGVEYHLNNPQIMRQPYGRIKAVPPLYFSQTKVQRDTASLQAALPEKVCSQQDCESWMSPEVRMRWGYTSPT